MLRLRSTLFVIFLGFFHCTYAAAPPTNFIFVNTLPKSGSVYIVNCLKKNLSHKGYSFIRISKDRFHDDYLNTSLLSHIKNKKYLSQEHVDASETNLRILKKALPKFVLHLRDPRQAMLSWVHHVEKVQLNHKFLWSEDICPPEEYFTWPFEEKIDWQIEHYLSACVDWIEEWCNAIDSGGLDILVTTFEEMKQDQDAFFKRILKFYNLNTPDFQTIPFQPGKNHHRKGSVDEWKIVCTPNQIARINEMVSDELLERFGWIR